MAEREIRADRRMSDVEALMWNVEKDPFLSSTFGSVTLLDRELDFDRFRRRLERMAARIPRLHQRVTPVLGRLAPPEWQDDPEFDLDFHVRRVALPSPGTVRELLDFATTFVQDPLDRTRPLWEFCIVEGIEGGRGALVQKMHHTITDGEGGIRMSEQFVDLTRDAADIEPEPVPVGVSGGGNLLDSTGELLGHTWRRGLGVAQRSAGFAAETVTHPARLPGLGGDAVETARSALRQLTVTDRSHSPLWRTRSLHRHFDVLDVPFDEAKRAAKELGGSLNDLFVAGAAGGAGAYHRELDTEVDRLRMAMPVSTRTDRSAGGNSFAPTRVLVPTDDDPLQRFSQVHEALTRTKAERAIGLVSAAAGVVNLLPTSMLVRITRQQVETVDFTTSNLRAAPFDLFMGGARVEGTYPLGPIAGTAFNLTMMSYCGTLNMGLHVDTGAVAEPDRLRRCLEEAFAELIAAGS